MYYDIEPLLSQEDNTVSDEKQSLKDRIKDKLGDNGMLALVGALAVGVGLLLGSTGTALTMADSMVDADLLDEICAEHIEDATQEE